MGNGKENKQNPVTISAIFQQRQCQCMSKTIGSGNFADLPLASRFFADDPPMPDIKLAFGTFRLSHRNMHAQAIPNPIEVVDAVY